MRWYLTGVACHYAPTWEGKYPRQFLSERTGYVQADGYAGLEALFTGPQASCINLGCWMHARRYFVQALESGDTRAAVPVDLIRLLYKVEELADLRGCDVDERKELRQQKSAALLDRLYAWMASFEGSAEPKTPLGKAITYLRNQWATLIIYINDGAIPIDNGEVERQIRPIARGRKAYLFAGSDDGGRRCAVLYTMMANCRIVGVDPEAWLTDVMDKLTQGWKQRDLAELLPQNWSAPKSADATPETTGQPQFETSEEQLQSGAM